MESAMYYIEKISKAVNSVVWGPIVLVFLIFVGVYFSFRFNPKSKNKKY